MTQSNSEPGGPTGMTKKGFQVVRRKVVEEETYRRDRDMWVVLIGWLWVICIGEVVLLVAMIRGGW